MNTGLLRPAVATTPTVYGIETVGKGINAVTQLVVATTPTVYGIETVTKDIPTLLILIVATVPTVYGIETNKFHIVAFITLKLQQHLPFTVLKPTCASITGI